MARRVASISISPDLAPYVDRYIGSRQNFSALVCQLLRAHFGQSGGGGPDMSGVVESQLSSRISEVQEEIARLMADMEHFRRYADEAKKEEERRAALLDDAIRAAYPEMEDGGIEGWRADACDAEISRYVRVRADLLASRNNTGIDTIRAAILRIYPALEAYL